MPERLGIAGSGAIACGLAKAAGSTGGAETVLLWARSDDSAERATADVSSAVRVVTELEEVAGAVRIVTELDELGECTVVVESIVEEERAKRELLGRLGELLPSQALLASTTSSLPVASLAKASGRPDRFAAMHFFNPVEKMELVELSFPGTAREETRQRAHALCEALGKQAVEVPDRAGFVVNRLLFPYLFSAVRMLEDDGLEPEALDTCMKLGAGHPMGPLALLDYVGLDVALAIGEAIGTEIPDSLRAHVKAGRLGKKTGEGFYEYG